MKQPACIILVILAVLGGLVAGAFGAFNHFPSAAMRALGSDTNAVLYSLHHYQGRDSESTEPNFHGYEILGQTTLKNAPDRALVTSNLRTSARGAWDGAACFEPRHGIRATGSSGTYDIVICFACGRSVVYHPDGHAEEVPIHGPPLTLNQILSAAGVPLVMKE